MSRGSSLARSLAKDFGSGGPMHQSSSSAGGASRPSFVSAYRMHSVIPGLGSVSVPSRSKKTARAHESLIHCAP